MVTSFLTAGKRALSVVAEVGGVALAIDAKNERATALYERFGAVRLLDDPLNLDVYAPDISNVL